MAQEQLIRRRFFGYRHLYLPDLLYRLDISLKYKNPSCIKAATRAISKFNERLALTANRVEKVEVQDISALFRILPY
jgi:hypothetical protein